MFNVFIIPDVQKNNSFHFIRLVCCFFVIYEHAVFLSQVNYFTIGLSVLAVKVFFILSGFWVTISLLRSKNIKEYAIKRCKKILPSYVTVVLGFSIILCVFSSLSAKEYFTNVGFWKYLAANLSTLNFLQPSLPGVFEGLPLNGAVNGALWTIKIEIAFYVCLPFFLFILNRYLKKTKIILVGLYVLSVAYSIVCHFLVDNVDNNLVFSHLQNQFPAFVTYFVCGMYFVFYWEQILKMVYNKVRNLI
ncbi:MAG: acyltransferase family protein [Treponema sp.]|nr:acyltransferase family protein [Treponema sp.]